MKLEFYTLSRYLFLKIEREYAKIVEQSGVTLPQLRILWILRAFPGANSSMISKIGCWTPPTVSRMIKILLEKSLISRDISSGKSKGIHLTEHGLKIIESNRQHHESSFPLLWLLGASGQKELDDLIAVYRYTALESGNRYIMDYIDKINELSLKIDYTTFPEEEQPRLKSLVELYNLLRVFVLSVENTHSLLLKKLDLTYPQMRALIVIRSFRGLTSSQLAEIALWSASSANLVVKNLLAKDLIYRNKGTVKNSLHMYTTRKADALLDKDSEENENKIGTLNLLDNVPTDKLRELNTFLHFLNKSVKNDMVVDFVDRCLYPVKKLQ
ncbi:MAG: MarR family transcriptional regulator [Firmicutes bacterium]|nr:MarR family transcriptional regulator [Bacillota bacterium]